MPLGVVLGVGLALGINALDNSFKTIDQAEEIIGLPVLGILPNIPNLAGAPTQVVLQENSNAAHAEAFRNLRAAVSMLGRADDRRVFLFTSALPQEGKTFCSVNFAVSLAQQGLQTLLIDCDLRRPNVEMAMFGVRKSTIGVTDYLAGQRELMDHRPNRARVPVFPAEGKLNHQRQSAVSFPLSAQEEFVGAINMLVNRGADVNARDKQGHTPLKRAIDYQQQESAEVLRRVGAVE